MQGLLVAAVAISVVWFAVTAAATHQRKG